MLSAPFRLPQGIPVRFEGTQNYVATDDLMMAVNAAVTLQRPLLVKGEPGTGKTQLAREIATALGRPFYDWAIKSTTKAQHGLYEYDAVSRLRDSQLGNEGVKLAPVEGAGLYVGEGHAFEGVAAILVEIADAIAGRAQRRDLPAAVVEHVEDRDDAFANLEKGPNRVARTKESIVLLPVPDAAKRQKVLQSRVIQRPAQIQRPADARVTRQA